MLDLSFLSKQIIPTLSSDDESQNNTENSTENSDKKKLTTKDIIDLFTPTNEVNTTNVNEYYFGRKAISLGKSLDELDVYKIVAKTVINPPTISTDISIELHFDDNNNYILCEPVGNSREHIITTYETLYKDIDNNGKLDYDEVANYVASYKDIINRGIYHYNSGYMNMDEARLCKFLGIDTTNTDGTHIGDLQAVTNCFGQPSYTHYEEDAQGNRWGRIYWVFKNTTICVNITDMTIFDDAGIAFVDFTWADGSFYLDYIKNILES